MICRDNFGNRDWKERTFVILNKDTVQIGDNGSEERKNMIDFVNRRTKATKLH